jgi:MFS transporter, SET family, sugar efflux transporter
MTQPARASAGAPGPARSFAPMVLTVVLLGLADSMTGSYLVLFAANHVGLAPVQVGVLVSAIALGGMVVTAALGRRFDRLPSRRYVVAAVLAGAVGCGLMSVTTSFVVLLLVGVTLFGAVAAGYPQLFALAHVVSRDRALPDRTAPLLRSGWSLAWAAGPLAAAAVLAWLGYRGLFWAAAVALLLTAVVAFGIPPPLPRPGDGAGREGEVTSAPVSAQPEALTAQPRRWFVVLLAGSIVLFHTAMFSGSVALPLLVTVDLGRPAGEVGLLFSACAVVEILAALGLAVVSPALNHRWMIVTGMVLFVGYFLLTVVSNGLALLLLAQVPRGVAIAIVGTVGISHFQAVFAPATGVATALFSNAGTAGSLASGVLAGVLIELGGATAALGCCAGLSLAAAATFLGAHQVRGRPLRH